jgi:hypothetical protein
MSTTADPPSSTSPSGERPPASQRSELEQRLDTRPQRPGLAHRIAAVWRDEYDTAMNWPRGKRHLLTRGLAVLVVNTIALLLVAAFWPGVEIRVDFPLSIVPAC